MLITQETLKSLKTENRLNGKGRTQTWRECPTCKILFKLPRLSKIFCSHVCCTIARKGVESAKKGKKYPNLRRARVGNCIVCSKEYRAVNDFKDRKQKFCSKNCFGKYWKKQIRPNIKLTNPAKDDRQAMWKGIDASYSAKHYWVSRKKGKPNQCQVCGTKGKRKYEWANIDHKYSRDKDDYIRMCTSCHRKYDIENFRIKVFGK